MKSAAAPASHRMHRARQDTQPPSPRRLRSRGALWCPYKAVGIQPVVLPAEYVEVTGLTRPGGRPRHARLSRTNKKQATHGGEWPVLAKILRGGGNLLTCSADSSC